MYLYVQKRDGEQFSLFYTVTFLWKNKLNNTQTNQTQPIKNEKKQAIDRSNGQVMSKEFFLKIQRKPWVSRRICQYTAYMCRSNIRYLKIRIENFARIRHHTQLSLELVCGERSPLGCSWNDKYTCINYVAVHSLAWRILADIFEIK